MSTILAMPPDAKDQVMADALDRMFIQNKIKRTDSAFDFYGASPPDTKPELRIPARGKESAGLVAHELGHLNPGALRRATIASDAALIANRTAGIIAIAIPFAAVISAGDGKYAKPEELERRAKFVRTLGSITAVASLPGVAEEVVASSHAVRLLRKAGDADALGRVLRSAGPGLATYLVPLAAPILAARVLERKARKGGRV